MILTLIRESILMAFDSMWANKLRTFLSLLGVTIGIFSIISVFTLVDSLETNVRNSVQSLGDNVVFVQKWPWTFGNNYPWWKYMNRPLPSLYEMDEIEKRSNAAEAVCFVADKHKTVKYRNNFVEGVNIVGASHNYNRIKSLNIETGRYFTEMESAGGRPYAIVGKDIAEGLFENANPIGKKIKLLGHNLTIIGVFKKEGESVINNSADNMMVIPLNYARTLVDIKSDDVDPYIMVKAKPGVSNAELIGELSGIMRSLRKLRPHAEENFALNETSLISQGLDGLFGVIKLAGWLIGGFAILVGGFGIANIMFVSVRERTNIIGIQKALGAKRYFILIQFLMESVFLCVVGGGLGILIIYLGTVVVRNIVNMDIFLSGGNIALGFMVSAIIGVVSGFIPAFIASRLDPVEAIRS